MRYGVFFTHIIVNKRLVAISTRTYPFLCVFIVMIVCLYVSGAFGPCPVLYDGMEIKHIMNDTLG